jgi:hypothetical protein
VPMLSTYFVRSTSAPTRSSLRFRYCEYEYLRCADGQKNISSNSPV